MTAKRVILELGAGNDLHGGDYTKAAIRAVQDAIHHSSLPLIRSRTSASTGGSIRARSSASAIGPGLYPGGVGRNSDYFPVSSQAGATRWRYR